MIQDKASMVCWGSSLCAKVCIPRQITIIITQAANRPFTWRERLNPLRKARHSSHIDLKYLGIHSVATIKLSHPIRSSTWKNWFTAQFSWRQEQKHVTVDGSWASKILLHSAVHMRASVSVCSEDNINIIESINEHHYCIVVWWRCQLISVSFIPK